MGGNELGYIQEAFASNWLSTVGPHLAALESDFAQLTGASCLALSSGTAAIHLGLKLLGVGPGDEVLVPTLSFVACSNPIRYEQAVPTFIDSEPRTWNIDPNLLSDLLKKRAQVNRLPAALVVVHLYGQSADLSPIVELCQRYEVSLLEDAANALGTLYKGKQVGTFGDVGVFSLGGNKIVTATAGGILVSQRQEWIDKARYWSTQARESDPDQVGNYLHSEIGFNYRMSNVLAAMGRAQLELLEERVQKRREVAFRYRDALKDIGLALMPQAPYGLHTNWLSCFLIDEAKFGLTQGQLIKYLGDRLIESRPVWKPMHTQKLYESCECIGGAVAEDLNRRGICLPSSSFLTPEVQQIVINTILEAHQNR